MRASHADREQVIGVLQVAFVQGRLTKDEFDMLVGQTLAARTWAELAALTADLPAGLTTVKPARPASAPGGPPVVRPGRVITAATALYAGAWAVVLLSSQIDENPLVRALMLDGAFRSLAPEEVTPGSWGMDLRLPGRASLPVPVVPGAR